MIDGSWEWIKGGSSRWHGNREPLTENHLAKNEPRNGLKQVTDWSWVTKGGGGQDPVSGSYVQHPHLSLSTCMPWREEDLKGKWQHFLTKGLAPLKWPSPLRDGHFPWEKARDGKQRVFVGKSPSGMESKVEPWQSFSKTRRCQQRQDWPGDSHS